MHFKNIMLFEDYLQEFAHNDREDKRWNYTTSIRNDLV